MTNKKLDRRVIKQYGVVSYKHNVCTVNDEGKLRIIVTH